MEEEERTETKSPPELTKIPEFLQGDNWFDMDVEDDFLPFDKPYRPPRYTMERGGIPFADVGEIHIISGKPGNGKTGLMSQLEAVTLGGKFGNTIARKVGHKENGSEEFHEKPTKLLHIDTEQGEDDSIAFKNRVISMSGIDIEYAKEHFFILRLRETEKAHERWQKILKAIWLIKPTDIYLDGMLDIVEDYNDQKECQPIIRKCMKLATHYDASLWSVLHENPLVDKLVGTLGSITQRKVSEIFVVIKVKQEELKPQDRRADFPDIYFKVKQVKARGKDVDNWYFKYETNAGGWGQPVELDDNSQVDPEEAKRRKETEEADELFKKFNWSHTGATYTDIKKYIISSGITSGRKIKDLFDVAFGSGIIYQDDRKKYYYNGLNKELPDDTVESIPFEQPDGEDVPF